MPYGFAVSEIADTDETHPLELDPLEHALHTTNTEHFEIHKGKGFRMSHLLTVANNATGLFEVRVPAGVYAHFRIVGINTDGPGILVDLIEGATFVAGTAAVVPVNCNRASTNTTEVRGYTNPGAIANGNVIDSYFLGGGGTGGSRSGGGSSGELENILDAGSYIIRVGNTGGASAKTHLRMFWYE